MRDSGRRDRVALIAPPYSYRIGAYIRAAGLVDIDLVIASDGEYSVLPQVQSGLQIPLDDDASAFQILVDVGRREQWDAIIAPDDSAVELAARVGQTLGLRNNPVEAAKLTRRKDLARDHLAAAGVAVPQAALVHLDADLIGQLGAVTYPCVAKPVALSASRGVIRADNRDELVQAIERIRKIVSDNSIPDAVERDLVLVEAYVPGVEVAIEGIVSDGRFEVIAVFDKPDPLEGPYFEETYYVTPSRLAPDQINAAVSMVRRAVEAYGLQIGPVHAEVRIDGDKAWIIEIASRTIGGDCARLLDYRLGRALEELVLLNALGRPVEYQREDNAAGVLMIPTREAGTLRRVEGVAAARGTPYIEDVSIVVRTGYELVPLPDGASYLGFIFARGPNSAAVEQALRDAHAVLRVVVAPHWDLKPA